jgi:hypothetical protein
MHRARSGTGLHGVNQNDRLGIPPGLQQARPFTAVEQYACSLSLARERGGVRGEGALVLFPQALRHHLAYRVVAAIGIANADDHDAGCAPGRLLGSRHGASRSMCSCRKCVAHEMHGS